MSDVDKEVNMSSWVYKCERCKKSFIKEVLASDQPAERAECPHCGYPDAAKGFEFSAISGG